MHAHLSVVMQQRTTSRPRAFALVPQQRNSNQTGYHLPAKSPRTPSSVTEVTKSLSAVSDCFQGWWSLPLLIRLEITCPNTEMIFQVWPGNSMSPHPCLLLFHQLIKLEVEAAFFLTGGVCFWVSTLKGRSVRKNSSSPRRAGRRQPRMENRADF